jgi:hypothetical protein
MNNEEFVAALQANASALVDLPFAEQVNVTHDPAKDTDGPVDGERLRAISKAESEAISRAFAEPPEREVLRATVDGRFVTTHSLVRGTLVDGTTVEYETEVRLEVDGGKLVGIHARVDTDQHRATLNAGKFERPAEAGAST